MYSYLRMIFFSFTHNSYPYCKNVLISRPAMFYIIPEVKCTRIYAKLVCHITTTNNSVT